MSDYMSEVGLAIKGEALQQLSKDVIAQKILDSANKHFQDKDNHLFIWNQIIWNGDEVNSFMFILFDIGHENCENYHLIDNNDLRGYHFTFGAWYDNPFNLRITKQLSYEVERRECDYCGGTGVRDFGLYTRVCECKLGE